MKSFKLLISIIVILASCSDYQEANSTSQNIEKWRLGWRMIQSSWNDDLGLAEKQFDSLLSKSGKIDYKFMATGLQVLHKLGKSEKLISVLDSQHSKTLFDLCNTDLIKENPTYLSACDDIKIQEVLNPNLQMKLIKMYVEDQAARGNLMKDIMEKHDLNEDEIEIEDAVTVDLRNRKSLREIFRENGFPTKEMVGKDAMRGIFVMIQHADGDKEWQKSQLLNIEKAVQKGDMDGQSYAYLYDRIKINNGEKQRYGTQFLNVDPMSATATLAETENIDSLDYRRMEVGMMPIDMYKKVMLTNISNR